MVHICTLNKAILKSAISNSETSNCAILNNTTFIQHLIVVIEYSNSATLNKATIATATNAV